MSTEKIESLLEEMLKALKQNEDRLLSPADISKEYNMNISKVREIFRSGKLPVLKLKPQRVLKSEWLKYLSNYK